MLPTFKIKVLSMLITVLKFSEAEQGGRGIGGRGEVLHDYIRNTPSDTEVHPEHQLRADRRT